ncbi:MAG: hypothetical protein ABIR73_07890 [Usitatibacter sp.]
MPLLNPQIDVHGFFHRAGVRRTRAQRWLAPPAGLAMFLERWCASATR